MIPLTRSCISSSRNTLTIPTNWWAPNRACSEAMLRSSGFQVPGSSEIGSVYLSPVRTPLGHRVWRCLSGMRTDPGGAMIEAAMIWNEPNNKSHWDLESDPGWSACAHGATCRPGHRRGAARLPRVLGGMSPIDPDFVRFLPRKACSTTWTPLPSWIPARLEPLADRRVASQARRNPRGHPSARLGMGGWGLQLGAEQVQEWGLRRTAELLTGQAPRIHWYSLYDLPAAWPATTRHKEAEGSSYYRHFHMGLLDEYGQPKLAARDFHDSPPPSASANGFISRTIGLTARCTGFGNSAPPMLRTGLSWADWFARTPRLGSIVRCAHWSRST